MTSRLSNCSNATQFRLSVFRVGLILIAVGLLSGCATVKKGFVTGEKVNLAPFADYTISTMLTTDFGFAEDKTFLIRPYLDFDAQVHQDYQQLLDEMDAFMLFLIEYSVDLVTLSESLKPEAEKIATYADFIETLQERILEKTSLNPSQLEAIISDIRNQPDLLSALRAAQPLINAGSRYALLQFIELEKRLRKLEIAIDRNISTDYTPFINYARTHLARRDTVLDAFAALNDYETGKKAALKALKQSTAIRKKELVSSDQLDEDQLLELESHLFNELRKLNIIEEQLKDDKASHEAIYTELREFYNEELLKIYKAALSVIVWGQAHQKMAIGIEDPAEWFDIKEEAPGLLWSVGKSLL